MAQILPIAMQSFQPGEQQSISSAMETGDVPGRVVVMQPRPGRIKRIVNVPLPRPRDRGSYAFAAIKEDVLAEFSGKPGIELVSASSRKQPVSDWQFSW